MWHGFGRFGYGGAFFGPWVAWAGPIAMVIFWALVVTALVFFIRYLARQSRSPSRESDALEILKSRYAKGEIAKEEYEVKRKDLL